MDETIKATELACQQHVSNNWTSTVCWQRPCDSCKCWKKLEHGPGFAKLLLFFDHVDPVFTNVYIVSEIAVILPSTPSKIGGKEKAIKISDSCCVAVVVHLTFVTWKVTLFVLILCIFFSERVSLQFWPWSSQSWCWWNEPLLSVLIHDRSRARRLFWKFLSCWVC